MITADGTSAQQLLPTLGWPPRRLNANKRPHKSMRAETVVGLSLLGALLLWHLWPVVGPGRLPQNLDLMLQYVPNLAHLGRGIAIGTVPLWNPWQAGGIPFGADPGTGAYYPITWLFVGVLSLWNAVRATIVFHMILAITGMYLCLRRSIGVGRPAAFAGTIAFALSPWLPGLAGMPVVLTSVSWLPLVVHAGLTVIDPTRTTRRMIALLGLGTAAQLASGWPAGAYLSWLTIGGAWLFGGGNGARSDARPSTSERLGWMSPNWTQAPEIMAQLRRLIGAGLLGGVIGAVVLVPGAEFVSQSTYGATRPIERLADLGYLTMLSWLRPSSGSGAVEGGQVSVGAVVPLLASVAPFVLDSGVRRRSGRTWVVLTIVALLLTWGTRTPLFGLLYQWLPGFRILYLPARLGIIASFAMACLAAIVIDHLATPSHRKGIAPRPNTLIATIRIVALGVLMPLFVVGQFWFSEGYDDFRRLLTNLWRFAGTPFVTLLQELHALLFVGIAVVVVILIQRRYRWFARPQVAIGLAGLVFADLSILRLTTDPPAFDPDAWYRPSLTWQGRETVGHDRFAGLIWHVGPTGTVRHFLGDFPASTATNRLPPNLGTLTATRDAQGYNPVLLTATARAYTTLGDGDDHWAWLTRFDPVATRALAVRQILAAPETHWRVTTTPLPLPTASDGGLASTRTTNLSGADLAYQSLEVISFLGEATEVSQGDVVAELLLTDDAGTRVVPLRAGIETAEWAYDRPDVRGRIAHRQAPISLVTRVTGAVGGVYDTFQYRATIDNTTGLALRTVAVRNTVPGVSVHVVGLAATTRNPTWQTDGDRLIDPQQDVSRLGVVPPDAGTATWIDDDLSRLAVMVETTRPAQLRIADTPYPGWVATINGDETPIRSAEPPWFGRIVDVPAGRHQVTMTFRPTSVVIGTIVSLIGLVISLGLVMPTNSSVVFAVGRYVRGMLANKDD